MERRRKSRKEESKVSKKKQSKWEILKELENNLIDRYHRWKQIFNEGSSDRMYEDGTGTQLVRNHIRYYKRQIEELLMGDFIAYPDSYWYPEPCELPLNFMAVDRPVNNRLLTANKTMSYNEAVKFNWKEVM